MKIQHLLIFCFLPALCGGNTGLIRAQVNVFTGAEAGSGTIQCSLSMSGSMKFFCKEDCIREEDILIKTDGVTAKGDRYTVEYKPGSSGLGFLFVTITNLTQSDSGQYRCGLGASLVPESYSDFKIRVSNAPLGITSQFILTNTEGENITYPCNTAVNKGKIFFCKNHCETQGDILIDTTNVAAQNGRYGIKYIDGSVFGLYVTMAQVIVSDTGWYRCGYGNPLSPASYLSFPILVLDAQTLNPTSSAPTTVTTGYSKDYLCCLVLSVSLVSVLLLVVCLLLLYIWKARRNLSRNTCGRTDGTNTEISVYANWAADQLPKS